MINWIKDEWEYSRTRTHFYNIKWFFKNIWRYRKQLYYGLRPWDSICGMEVLKENLKDILQTMQDPTDYMQEVDETRLPKEKDIARVIELIENQETDNYAERCGYKWDYEITFEKTDNQIMQTTRIVSTATEELEVSNMKAIEKGRKLEEKEHKELMKLLGNYRGWWI